MNTALPSPRSARQVKIAISLWLLLAIVVFNVRFDWRSRVAGHAFVQAQLARQQQRLPSISINDGFRPMVRDAARDAALWSVFIAAFGAASVAAVRPRQR
jgi:hypothetical protein